MLKQTIIFAAVAGLVFALAPAAQAAISYYEDFVCPNPGDYPKGLSTSCVGWIGHSHVHLGYWPSEAAGDDGDQWHLNRLGNESVNFAPRTEDGEYTVPGQERNGNTVFKCDWAGNTARGMKFIAKVGTTWYGSETFGEGADDHGTASGTTYGQYNSVSEWENDVSVNVDTDTWYESLIGVPEGCRWKQNANVFDTTNPLNGVPSGDITQFGIVWANNDNFAGWSLDNFQVTPEPASAMLLLIGAPLLALRRRRRS